MPAGKRKPPVGEDIAENRTFSYQQIHAHKPLFGNQGNQGKVLSLGHLDFDIVSNFDIRISDFTSPRSSTTVENPLQISSFMQNKAKFRKSQMNVNKVLTKDYDKKTLGERGKKQSQTNPNKANLPNAKMNVNKVLTKDYENKSNWALFENKPNTKPNKPNFKGKKSSWGGNDRIEQSAIPHTNVSNICRLTIEIIGSTLL